MGIGVIDLFKIAPTVGRIKARYINGANNDQRQYCCKQSWIGFNPLTRRFILIISIVSHRSKEEKKD